jgi:hypothetical protein
MGAAGLCHGRRWTRVACDAAKKDGAPSTRYNNDTGSTSTATRSARSKPPLPRTALSTR